MMDLTVAICMYNAERYVAETLECLRRQTVQDYNLMIINDCSTDGSVAVVENFFKKHPREYELISLPVNGGLAAGRRYVEEHALTRYLLFVDADDCPRPRLVESLYNKITSDDELIAVGCHLRFIDSEGHKLNGGIFLGETEKTAFIEKAKNEKLIFMQPTAIYDREVALRVGGHSVNGFPDEGPRYRDLCEDLDLWTRMSDLYTEGKAIVVIPEILCDYRKHEKAMSTDSTGMVLRMKHIKTNLKRRRRGEADLSFIEYRKQLLDKEYNKIVREANAADSLRRCYYSAKRGRLFAAIKYLCLSIYNRPGYFIDKVKHNILRMK